MERLAKDVTQFAQLLPLVYVLPGVDRRPPYSRLLGKHAPLAWPEDPGRKRRRRPSQDAKGPHQIAQAVMLQLDRIRFGQAVSPDLGPPVRNSDVEQRAGKRKRCLRESAAIDEGHIEASCQGVRSIPKRWRQLGYPRHTNVRCQVLNEFSRVKVNHGLRRADRSKDQIDQVFGIGRVRAPRPQVVQLVLVDWRQLHRAAEECARAHDGNDQHPSAQDILEPAGDLSDQLHRRIDAGVFAAVHARDNGYTRAVLAGDGLEHWQPDGWRGRMLLFEPPLLDASAHRASG